MFVFLQRCSGVVCFPALSSCSADKTGIYNSVWWVKWDHLLPCFEPRCQLLSEAIGPTCHQVAPAHHSFYAVSHLPPVVVASEEVSLKMAIVLSRYQWNNVSDWNLNASRGGQTWHRSTAWRFRRSYASQRKCWGHHIKIKQHKSLSRLQLIEKLCGLLTRRYAIHQTFVVLSPGSLCRYNDKWVICHCTV